MLPTPPARMRALMLAATLVLLGGAAPTAAATLAHTAMSGAAPGTPSVPLLWSGIQDLSPACAKAVLSLEARLAMNDTAAFSTVLEASFASGRVIEGLYVLDQGVKAARVHPPSPEEQKEALNNLINGYPYVSLGAPDACGFVPDFQYCHLDVAMVYVRFGVCVPSACNAQDIQLGLNATYHKLTQQYLDSSLLLANTTVCGQTSFPATTGTWVMVGLTVALLLLAAAGSALDLLRKREAGRQKRLTEQSNNSDDGYAPLPPPAGAGDEKWYMRKGGLPSLLLCFSLPRNWQLLFAKKRGGPFDSLDGIRTLSMCWVIFGHTFIFALLQVSFSNQGTDVIGHDNKGFLATYPAQSVTGGYFAVDTFFFLSAFLAVYFMLEEMGRLARGRHSHRRSSSPHHQAAEAGFLAKVPMVYLLRFLRLTPTYFFVVLMYWKVLRLADKGPFWTQMLAPDYDNCDQNWWLNLLYVNNLVVETNDLGQPGLCYPVSWYLGVDFQLFLITPLFALLGFRRPKATLAFLGLLSTASILYTWIQAVEQHWTIDLLDQSTYFEDYYIKPWTRAPPALIGMALAVVWFHHYRDVATKSSKASSTNNTAYRLLRPVVYALLLAALALFGLTVAGARSAYADTPPPWSTARMAAYIALSKPAWTVGLALLCFLLFLGEGGPIKQLLESRPFTVTSRLTYCAYLVHPAVIFAVYGDHLGPLHYSWIWYTFHFLGFLASVLLLSIFVHLLVERPVANLERLTRSSPPPSSSGPSAPPLHGDGRKGKGKKEDGFAKAVYGGGGEEKFGGEGDGNGAGGITEPLLASTLQEQEEEEGGDEEAGVSGGRL